MRGVKLPVISSLQCGINDPASLVNGIRMRPLEEAMILKGTIKTHMASLLGLKSIPQSSMHSQLSSIFQIAGKITGLRNKYLM